MNDAIRAAQQAHRPATLRLPVIFAYPLGGIIGRTAIGLALLAAGFAMLLHYGIFWMAGAAILGLFGIVVTVSNLLALADPDRRKIVLDQDGVEIRYGFSRRYYRFLEYSDYRVARLGLRRFLVAVPVELERALGERAQRVRITIYDRPAFLTPMPVLGGGAPASLLEWQTTLNELRRAAIAAAGLSGEFERAAQEDRADEARRAAEWRARERAGAKPSRLSRGGYARGRVALGLLFLVLLLAPIGFVTAMKDGAFAFCSGCQGVAPAVLLAIAIGGPILAILVFVLGNARMIVRRAHDLDQEIAYWRAALDSLFRRGPLQRRLNGEQGTAGTNRFGPPPAP